MYQAGSNFFLPILFIDCVPSVKVKSMDRNTEFHISKSLKRGMPIVAETWIQRAIVEDLY